MSRLHISPDLLIRQLFEGTQPQLRVVEATFDQVRRTVVLEIEGPGVPEAEEVQAICHKQEPLRVEFKPR